MQLYPSLYLGILALGSLVIADKLDYAESIHALSYGNVETQGNAAGTVWLNISGFAPDKLPHIQHDVGIYSLDNMESLKSIAGLAAVAAKEGKWGDVVYLHNAFTMNGHAGYIKASSSEMRDGLLEAVTKADKSGVDSSLIDLYAKTSSSPDLAAAFEALHTTPVTSLEKRWTKETCSRAHQAAKNACRSLASSIRFNATIKRGGPRSICKYGCCISWSANATFQLENLYPAANYCISACGSGSVSCEVYGVSLQGTIVDQCLSNRATGCK
ncbi:hypothetical protein QQS21_003397 [Conoideocrella luteorostrata]|uniref:WD-like domain-containing protein n=1 Tax=Conoideocrella luteorostrata TaxID=1105319 RepID=A0AAJ0CTI4_9HYPO|nr:hypothetical protein QQS21_003397 [Conoideocrella luteorostrata]